MISQLISQFVTSIVGLVYHRHDDEVYEELHPCWVDLMGDPVEVPVVTASAILHSISSSSS